MEQKPSTARIALKWGFLTAIAVIIYSTVLSVADLWTNQGLTSISYLFLIAGIVFALKEFKASNYGFMSIGEGLGLGTLLSTIVGLLGSLYSYIYFSFIDTTMMEKIIDFQRQKMEEQGLAEEQIDQAMQMTASFMTPGMMFIMGVLGYLVIGFIISLVVAAIMKQNKPEI